jgi:alanine-glyoxylate transaminase/serine-glyoxylate transaminase/serine-pyruvate transaminase
MTALYVPEGATPAAVIGALSARGIVIAGGLHKDIKTKFVFFALSRYPRLVLTKSAHRYIRFGHMGETVVRTERGDVDRMIAGLESAWAEVASK